MINMLCQQTKELAQLKADNEARKLKEKEKETVEDNTPILGNRLMLTQGPTANAGFGAPNGFAPQPTGYSGF